jgi:hypothetical protein
VRPQDLPSGSARSRRTSDSPVGGRSPARRDGGTVHARRVRPAMTIHGRPPYPTCRNRKINNMITGGAPARAGAIRAPARSTFFILSGHTNTRHITPDSPPTSKRDLPSTRRETARGSCRLPRLPGSPGRSPGHGRATANVSGKLKAQAGASRRCPECGVKFSRHTRPAKGNDRHDAATGQNHRPRGLREAGSRARPGNMGDHALRDKIQRIGAAAAPLWGRMRRGNGHAASPDQ